MKTFFATFAKCYIVDTNQNCLTLLDNSNEYPQCVTQEKLLALTKVVSLFHPVS